MSNSSTSSTPRTILFLDHTAVLGGGEIALFNLITHLDTTRFTPVVLLFSSGPLEDKLRAAKIETHILPLSPTIVHTRKDQLDRSALSRGRDAVRMARYVLKLARFIRKRKPNLIHTNSLKADIIGGVAARMSGVLLVWHIRDRIADDYLPPKVAKVFRALCRTIPHAVIANSRATFETLQLPIHSKNASRVVHDGIAISSQFIEQPFHDGAPLIGIVGRLSAWKGQHIFLEAAQIVEREFPSARFQIIGGALFGEEEYENQLKKQCEKLDCNHQIEWLGMRDDVPQLIEKLDLLVHASTVGEPFGQVVIEGMNAGKPVVATDGGGVPEIIENGVSGVLVPMNDAPALANAMLDLLRDPAQAQAIGAAGYARAKSHFSIERVARDVESVYDAMLESSRK